MIFHNVVKGSFPRPRRRKPIMFLNCIVGPLAPPFLLHLLLLLYICPFAFQGDINTIIPPVPIRLLRTIIGGGITRSPSLSSSPSPQVLWSVSPLRSLFSLSPWRHYSPLSRHGSPCVFPFTQTKLLDYSCVHLRSMSILFLSYCQVYGSNPARNSCCIWNGLWGTMRGCSCCCCGCCCCC